jgi:hypothetical protein
MHLFYKELFFWIVRYFAPHSLLLLENVNMATPLHQISSVTAHYNWANYNEAEVINN